MNLQTFADQYGTSSFHEFAQHYSRICFVGKEYPLLLFSSLWRALKRKNNRAPVRYLDISKQDYASVIAQLQVSFLGQHQCYWLADISIADAHNYKMLEKYLIDYAGPNTVLFFTPQTIKNKNTDQKIEVILPDSLEMADALAVARLLDCNMPAYTRFIQDLFKHIKTIPIDSFCLLLEYGSLIGGDTKSFFDDYLFTLVVPQQSLFTLSQYFFAKQEQQFFSYWAQLKDVYSPLFWCSFWSEQLWRAYHFINFTKQNNSTAARAMSFRLPFSFLKKDWHTIVPRDLQQAHERIYAIDHALKNGGDPGMLDLFYAQFLFK